MMKKLQFVLFFACSLSLLAQENAQLSQEELYKHNISQEYLNDIYIPVDVMDAMGQLDELSDEGGRTKLLEADEQLAADRLVMGLGKWMIVKWNFYDGSRLSHKLKEYGVSHPDDMAKFLIVSYHRYLRDVPQDLEERGASYFDQRKKEQEIRKSKKKKIESP